MLVRGVRSTCRVWRRGLSAAAEPAAHQSPSQTINTYNWEDPFHLASQLTEDEILVRDTARAFAQEELLPRVVEASRYGYPKRYFPNMREKRVTTRFFLRSTRL